MRICSFVPAATEILFALGLEDDVVGVTHECAYPPPARQKPRVVESTMATEGQSSRQIDEALRATLARGEPLYRVNTEALHAARPELLVTQSQCDVCAPSASVVAEARQHLGYRPEVLTLHAHTLEDALSEIQAVGRATGRERQANELLGGIRERVARVQRRVAQARTTPRVFCLEWFEPPFATGHWVPEMVRLAGGTEVLGRAGERSRTVTWAEIAAARPEVLVLMACGFSIARSREEASVLTRQPAWGSLPAVRDGKVYLVDGPAYFNGAGPRLVHGIELLAGLVHPDTCADLLPGEPAAAPL